jgi:hypothetical protein
MQAHVWQPWAYTVEVTVAKVMSTVVSVLGWVTVVAYVVAPGTVTVRVVVAKKTSVLVFTWPVVLNHVVS